MHARPQAHRQADRPRALGALAAGATPAMAVADQMLSTVLAERYRLVTLIQLAFPTAAADAR